ncbi:MAG: nucleotide-binding protein [Methylococcales bacterium]|nr:nucleotide-binding protein [Methylococcales bacterium]
MPTFDIVSEFDKHELKNAIDQANKEVAKLSRRGIDISCMETGDPKPSGKGMRQEITMKQGLDSALAKKIVKLIKDKKLKVQAAIQGDQVRVTGKSRDDLQEAIKMLREEKLDMPLQFENFRD